MTHYKLTYFNFKALAESIRFLFAYGNIEFEDVRIDLENWPELKPTMPMAQMPILEVDGKRVHQSLAITRYLAKQVGLTGANDWENLEIDLAVDTINDFRWRLAIVSGEKDEEIKAKKRIQLQNEIIPFYLEKLDGLAKANNGHFALKKLTWVDLYFTAVLDYMNWMGERNLIEDHPNLQKVVDNVLKIENIKKWVEKRPKTDL